MDTGRNPAPEPETAELQTVTADASLVLGRYKLGRRLGAGGFATVYAAHDERLDRPVAIKVLPRERVIHSRFEREARAAARLHHPSIVTLFEAAVDDEGAYLVSELVKGTTLDQALELGELSDRDILEVAIALADALEHAHANHVVHRDVKPQNVLIPARKAKRAAGNGHGAAKLTDFGVARVLGGDTLTRTGDVIGTLAYMSPEQAEGAESGAASDLYSLALLTYEALTGINPVVDQIRRGRSRRLGVYLPPLRRQRADLPRHLGAAIDQALRPRPSERGTVADLSIALTAALPLVDDDAGVVAPARAMTITRRADGDGDGARDRGRDNRPGPEWSPDAGPRSIPAMEPPAHSRTQTLELAPNGLLLVAVALLAVPLGFLGLAGAWPAILTQTVRGFWRRSTAAVAGFAALGLAGHVAPRNFYYQLDHATLATLEPAAIGAGIWGLAAALAPLLTRGVRPRLDLAMVTLVAAAGPIGLSAAGLHHITGLVPGALLGWLIAAHRPLIGVIRDALDTRTLS